MHPSSALQPAQAFLAATACILLAFDAQAAAPPESWIADSKGCKVYNPNPLRGESVTWSGSCVGGFAEGEGLLSWFRRDKPGVSYSGEMHAGRHDGKGLLKLANGDKYEGEFYAGKYDGAGVYTFANGNRYEGDFVAGGSTRSGTLTLTDKRQFRTDLVTGIKWPTDFLTPAVLLVMCFDAASVLQSVDLVRTTGYPLDDEKAIGIVKVRDAERGIVKVGATGGEQMVADPIPGCHMVGVAYEQGGYVIFRRP